ncbi:MAG: bifunctional DNA primase/polymerase, partial [Alphaproteobacteria bacterium]|nr:bifunctional DNA primase/polymerase [Alphaproteobacteria bacterium]
MSSTQTTAKPPRQNPNRGNFAAPDDMPRPAPAAAPAPDRLALPAPSDRLPTDRDVKSPPLASPYWTTRGQEQRDTMIALLEPEQIAEAAALLADSGEYHRPFKNGEYAGVFEHNTILLAAALAYAERGLRVIDLHGFDAEGCATGVSKDAKIPRGAAWQERASNDRADIIRFFQGAGRYPENKDGVRYKYVNRRQPRNLGIATGGDIFALDVDPDGMAWLESKLDDLPNTVMETTGRGGCHMLFRLPEGVTVYNSAHSLAPGVDIRGEGGQIVCAPSLHKSGNFYTWGEGFSPLEVEIADAPAWLIEAAIEAGPAKSGKARKVPTAPATRRKLSRDQIDAVGFEARIACFGDGDDRDGFDGAIYSAACAWFGAAGWDADATDMIEKLRAAILDAPCSDNRNEARYATDDYLLRKVEQARDFIASHDADDDDDNDARADAGSQPATAQTDTGTPDTDGADSPDQPDTGADAQQEDDAAGDQEPRVSGCETYTPPTRKIADPLYTAKLVKDGWVRGKTDKKLQENTDSVRVEMRAAMRDMFALVIMEGGDARAVLRPQQGQACKLITKTGLADTFANRTVAYGNGEKRPGILHPGNLFITDPNRPTYLGMQFEPDSRKANPALFNTWTGFIVRPRPGDWSLLENHIRDQIIAGNESAMVSAEYLYNWHRMRYAHLFQCPGEKIGNSLVYMGGEGVGKSKFADWIRQAIGSAALKIAQRKHLVGNFNAGLEGKIYVVSEEAFFSGDKEAAGVMKDMITDDKIEIERKGFETVTRSNYIRTDIITNEKWAIPTGDNGDARRFAVFNVNDNRKQDRTYFAAIDAQMKAGGVEAMAHDLMTWNPADHCMEWAQLRNPPWTPARAQQGTHGLVGPRALLLQIIESGVLNGKTAGGDTFYYSLSDHAATTVARTHLNAALTGGGKAYGGTGVAIQSAIDDMIGIGAAKDTRVAVTYYDS